MEGIRLTGSFLTKKSPHKFVFLASDDLQTDMNGNGAHQLVPTKGRSTVIEDDDVTLETLPSDDTEFIEKIAEEDEKSSKGTTGAASSTSDDCPTDVDASMSFDAPCSFADLPKHLALELLEDCIINNPVAALNNHFMKIGVQDDFKGSFREEALYMPGRPNIYRSCVFICPITGTVYTCTLPKCLLDTKVEDSLVQAAKSAFGDFSKTNDGQVVFSTKKGAKRCVAMVALYGIQHSLVINQTDTNGARDASLNGEHKRAGPSPRVAAKFKSSTPFLTEQDLNRRAKHLKRIQSTNQSIPSWVHDLYRIGVQASHVKISYQGEAGDAGWNCTPTLIRCVLEIDEPTTCIITGDALPSKELAFESAAVELCGCLRRMKLANSSDKSLDFDFEAKQRLLACDSTVEVSYTSIPAWGHDIRQLIDCDTCTAWYSYKLDFVTASGASFVSEQSGIDKSIAAPLGIVFPRHVSPSEFVIDQEESDVMNGVTLRLSKLGTVAIDEPFRVSLQKFNLSLDQWKRYSKEEAMRLNGRFNTTVRDTSSSQDYTYYFAPLKGEHADQINLDILDKVATKTCVAYTEPHPWSIFCHDLLATMRILCNLLLISFASSIFGEGEIRTAFSSQNAILFPLLISTAMLHLLSIRYRLPMARLSRGSLQNCFLVHKGVSNTVYVTASNAFADDQDNLTGLSTMPGSEETYAEYYQRRHNMTIDYPSEALIPCTIATSNSKNDFLLRKEPIGDAAALVPELVWLLPMPRHYLYLARHTEKCMVHLERDIELSSASKILLRLADEDVDKATSVCLSSLLGEATTLAPKPTYQRLEFLGDSVLGFYFTIVLFATNFELVMTYDDVGACLEQSVKNDALFAAALRIGANRLLFTSQRQRKWRVNHSENNEFESISDSIMSDAVESLLGATFIYDSINQQSSVSIAFFQQLQLPISGKRASNSESVSAIDALSSSLNHGYPFEKDVAWMKQLSALNDSMTCDEGVAKELREKRHALVTILSSLSVNNAVYLDACATSKILLTAALFHDDEIDSIDDSKCESNGITDAAVMTDLLRLSRFRDTLFFVGAYALQLCITTDLYHRFPDIDEGGLHILRARAISDDIVVYIMFKAGIHKTVYNLSEDIIEEFEAKMMKADTLGKLEWQSQGGWVLPGGIEEFASRRRISPSEAPQYPGCWGGRLFGERKKLDLKYTEEPMFVIKAIIGAIVLSNGMHPMWKCIGPLFEEVLLLTPEESLKAYPESNIK